MDGYLLGIDIGTSGCKAAVFTLDGHVLAHTSEGYPVRCPGPGHAEQDPEEWWGAVCRAIKRILAAVPAETISAVGVDGQSWSAVAMDKYGRVLSPTPIWTDTRALTQCKRMVEACGEDALFQVCGNPVQPSYTTPKVLWYKDSLPDVYRHTDKILQSNSFIVYRLTGTCVQDHSQGYGWCCYDMAKGQWDLDICRTLGMRESLLPELVPCHQVVGRVTSQAAQQCGLLEGTPVAAGGLDAACGALGAGVIDSGQTHEQGGQAGGMSVCMNEPKAARELILSPHVVPGRWLLQGGTVGGGGALNWFLRQFGSVWDAAARESGENAFALMDKEASRVPHGCEGVVFLPYLSGERTPLWNPAAKGVFYGLQFSTGRGHMARAVMEGVAFSLRHNLETAYAAGAEISVMHSVGGAANSPLWMQIKSDITQRTMEVTSSDTATALGAAILAGVGVGAYQSFEEAAARTVQVKRVYRPDPGLAGVYDRTYRLYRELYDRLKPVMDGRVE